MSDAHAENEMVDTAALSGLYALDALDGEELVRFERALGHSEELQAEVDSFRETAGQLSHLAAEPAPESLRGSVLADIAATRQVPPSVTSIRDTRSARVRSAAWLAAAAVIAIIAGVTGYALAPNRSTPSSDLTELLAADDAQMMPLAHAHNGTPAGSAVMSPSESRMMLITKALPALDDDRTYELWAIAEDGPRRAAIFRHDEDGVIEVKLEGGLAGAIGVAVTDEPAGGSDAPTTPVLIEGTVA
jgi:anti-sigma-K factor RskA